MSRSKDGESKNDEDEEGKELKETRQGVGGENWSIVDATVVSSKTCIEKGSLSLPSPHKTGCLNLRIPMQSSGDLLIH